MQTILGSGGAIGVELAKALTDYTKDIRLVSRHPKKVNPNDQLYPADLTKPENISKAVEGADVAYLTIGLNYDTKVWRSTWPLIMRKVIDACKTHGVKLVFFDNIYMYDPDHMDSLTEETPVRPTSKKGMVRKEIAELLMDETKNGNLKALIARSADFYGPSIGQTSVLNEIVFKNFYNGKKANWMGPVQFRHSFTYTPDAGKATAILGNTDDAYNQVWHLPTAPDPMTGKEWIEAIAKEIGVKPKYQVIPKWMMRIIGIFVPVLGEMVEMLYQYDRDYIFKSTKFEERFDFKATPYVEGIKKVVETDYKKL